MLMTADAPADVPFWPVTVTFIMTTTCFDRLNVALSTYWKERT